MFVAFAFIDALGSIVKLGCVLSARHNFDTFFESKYPKQKPAMKSDEQMCSLHPSMTNSICQYSKPIFFQFNIMFFLDRPTLTTYLHSSEKYTRFILYTRFLREQSILLLVRFLLLLPLARVATSRTGKCRNKVFNFSIHQYVKLLEKDSCSRFFFNQKTFHRATTHSFIKIASD